MLEINLFGIIYFIGLFLLYALGQYYIYKSTNQLKNEVIDIDSN
jgi:hypothetical protein